MKKLLFAILFLLTQSVIAQVQLPSYVPQSGLAAWWGLNGNANDMSLNNNNGSMYSVSIANDRFGAPGGASYFNGTASSYIQVAHHSSINFNATDEYTISLWLNPENNTNNGHAGVLSKWCENFSTPYPYAIRILDLGEDAKVFWQNHTSSTTIKADAMIAKYSYTHILVTVKNQKTKLYINNTFIDSSSFSTNTISNTNDLYIGKRSTNSPRRYKGAIDDIGIWNRALTACERQSLYQSKSLQIKQQPTDTTINTGSNAAFYFQYTDSIPSSFQWQSNSGNGFQNISNNVNYSGTNKDTLFIKSAVSNLHNTSYRCIITNGSCTDTTTSAQLVLTTSIKTPEAGNWQIYPNPASNQLFIRPLKTSNSQYRIRLYTINGERLKEYGVFGNSGTITLNLNNLKAGIYLLEIESDSSFFRSKIIHF